MRIASSSTGSPLRGSSNRPRKPIVGPSTPRVAGQRRASAKAHTCTPFGMITASPPRCSTCTRRAKSDTAIRPVIRSSHGRTTGPQAASHFDRVVAAWNVATIGPLAIMQTSSDTDGGAGSCTWTTSKCPSRSHRRTRAAETGPNWTLAIEPLYGIGTVRPAKVIHSSASGLLLARPA